MFRERDFHNRQQDANANKHGQSYPYSDSQCQRGFNYTCLECPLTKCVLDKELVRVRNIYTNTY